MQTQPDIQTFLQMLVSMAAPQGPVFLMCLTAIILVLVKWKQAPAACLWALLGFGLRLLLCVAIPVVQTAVHYSRIHGHHSARDIGVVLSSLSLVWSLLTVVSYALMLAAIFAGRPKTTA